MELENLLRNTRHLYIALPSKDVMENLTVADATECMAWAIHPSAKIIEQTPNVQKAILNKLLECGILPKLEELEATKFTSTYTFESPSTLRECHKDPHGRIVKFRDYLISLMKNRFVNGELELTHQGTTSTIPKADAKEYTDIKEADFAKLGLSVGEFIRYAKLYSVQVSIEPEKYQNLPYDVSKDEQFLSVWELAKLLVESKGEPPERGNIINEARHWFYRSELSPLTEWGIKPGLLDNITESAPFDEQVEVLAHAFYIRMDSAYKVSIWSRKPAGKLRGKLEERLAQISLSVPQRVDNSLETQAEALPDDGAGSQAAIELASTKAVQANSNEFAFSGLLNIPRKQDGWFSVIDDMTRAFYRSCVTIPNEFQAWAHLCKTPPDNYKIETGTDKGGEDCLKMPGAKPLSKSAFSKRWANYTANKPQ